MIELSKFVEESLVQLMDGVKGAQEKIGSNGAIVNPQITFPGPAEEKGRLISQHTYLIQEVEFDIAVTATEGGSAETKVGVLAGALGFGAKAEVKELDSSVSRIKFKVPVRFSPSNG